MLNHLNVTKGNFSLGVVMAASLLGPLLSWTFFPPTSSSTGSRNRQKAWSKCAERGKGIDVNVLKDMRNDIDQIRDQLFKRVNDLPTGQYLEAKRFLNDFDNARQCAGTR